MPTHSPTHSATYSQKIPTRTTRSSALRAVFVLFLPLLLAGALAVLGSSIARAQGTGDGDNTFEPLNPFAPGSNLLGLTDEAPLVSYNEFTGDVTLGLAVGVPGFGVPVHFSRDGLRQLQHYGIGAEEEVGALGRSWHVGHGFLQANRPYPGAPGYTCDPAGNSVCSRGVGWTALVEPSGHVTDFHRDYLFRELQDEEVPVVNEAHFLDSSLRRITREASEPFTHGPYVLLDADGTKTTFEPVYGIPAGDPHDSMRFYPTTIEDPTGRVTTLTYRDAAGVVGLGRPLPAGPVDYRRVLDTIVDSWQRTLRFDYYTPAEMQARLGANADPALVNFPRLREVRLEDGASSLSLGTFDYALVELPWGAATRQSVQLVSYTTAEGHVTGFGYGSSPAAFAGTPLDNGIPLLKFVDLPTGGRVNLEYQRFDEKECQGAPPPDDGTILGRAHLRLLTLEHGGEIYTYDYAQGTGLDPADGPDGELRVELTTASGRYDRTTTYLSRHVQEDLGGVCSAWHGGFPRLEDQAIGRPLARAETWRDRHGVETRREEEWDYQVALLATTDAVHLGRNDQIRRDEGSLYTTLVTRYSQEIDGVWIDTDFTYDLHPGAQDETSWYSVGNPQMAEGHFDFPVSITRGARGGTERVEQTIDYLHRVRYGAPPSGSVDEYEHAVGLRRSIEAVYHHADASVETLGKTVSEYFLDSENRTLLEWERSYRAPGDFLETRYTYHPEGALAEGLVHTETLGVGPEAVTTQFLDYAYGTAQRVVPGAGPETTRMVSWNGTVSEETTNGVRTVHQYDDDLRRVVSEVPGSGEWPSRVDYSAPADPQTTIETYRGWNESDRNQASLERQDPWGRPSSTRTVIDLAPWVEASTSTLYGPVGLVDRSTSATGATTESTWDVHGREVESRTRDANGVELSWVARLHSRSSEGHTTIEEVRRIAEAGTAGPGAQEVRRITVRDLAGRVIHASTNEDLYQLSLDEREGGFTSVEYRAELLDGVERRRQTLAPYGTPQRTRYYDWLGNLVREIHPETGTVDFVYDSRGRLAFEQTASGRLYEYVYDAADRLVERRDAADPASPALASYTYDPASGRRVSATTVGGVVTTRQFDPVTRRPISQTQRVPYPVAGPAGLAPSGPTPAGAVELSWTPVPGARFYQVQAWRDGALAWRLNDLDTATATIPSAIWDGAADLEWRVRAFDVDYAPSAWSSVTLEPEVVVGEDTAFTVAPSPHDFGGVSLDASVEQTFTVTHAGGPATTLQVTGITAPFAVTSGGSLSLAVGGTASFTLRFRPTEAGVFDSTAVLVAADGGSQGAILSGEGVSTSSDGELLVPPAGADLDFGVVTTGTSGSLDTILRNVGTGVLDAVTVSFSDPAFAMGQGWPCPPLATNEACRPEIVLTPSAAGVVQAQATFRHVLADGTVQEQTASLRGEGYTPGALVVEKGGQAITELDLGQVPAGVTTPVTFDLRNTSAPNPGVDTSTYASANAPAPFTGSVAATLQAGEVQTAGNFQITPQTTGTIVRHLTIASTNTANARLTLRVEVVDADLFSVSPASISLAPIQVYASQNATVQVQNLTAYDRTILVETRGDLDFPSPSQFLAPAGTPYAFTVGLHGTRVGALSGEICFSVVTSIPFPEPEEECLPVYGEGLPGLVPADSALDLGVVPVGRAAAASTSIAKQVAQAVAGEIQVAPPFADASGATIRSFALAQGSSLTEPLDVILAPAQAGTWSGALQVTADTGETHVVTLTGRTVTPALSGGAFVDFGALALDEAASVTVPITNPTEVPIRARLVVPPPFTGPADVELAPGASADLVFGFTPSAEGSFTADVELRHAPATGDLGFDQLLHTIRVEASVLDDRFDEAWPSAVFASAPDPVLGREIVQLTDQPGENHSLYVGAGANDGSGRFLVYRNLLNASPSTLTYYRLDLETGATQALAPTGLANAGTVRGEHFYYVSRPSFTDAYDEIRRRHLETGADQLVVTVPGSLVGNLDVAFDESAVLYTYHSGLPAGGEEQIVAVHRSTDPSDGSQDEALLVGQPPASVNQLAFDPSSASRYSLRTTTASSLGSILVGDFVGPIQPEPPTGLGTTDPLFARYGGMAYTFWDADGGFWVALVDGLDPVSDPDLFVRLAFTAPGAVESDESVVVDGDAWQQSVDAGRPSGWLAGSGSSPGNGGAGRPFVQLVRLATDGDPATRDPLERHELASSLGAVGESHGLRHANARLLESLDALVFTAPYDLESGALTDGFSRHVFLVRLPDRLRRSLVDASVAVTAEGPFVHGNRAVVSSDLAIDYGAPDGLGDGVADVTAGDPASLPFVATHHAFADLDGDGIDDRVFLRQEVDGWRAFALPTDLDGSFDDAAPTAERFWPIQAVRPPLFGDLDGDGFDDLLLVITDGQVGSLRWQVYRNPGHTLPRAVAGEKISDAYMGDPVAHEAVFFEDVDGDGFADRVVANRATHGGWTWQVDLSTAGALGDSVIDSRFDGGDQSTDTPLVGDVDGDGRADVVIARTGGASLRWYVNPTTAGGPFGNAWTWNGFFGDPAGTPHLVHLVRFATRR